MRAAVGYACIVIVVLAGCRSKERYRASNDRVSVDAPFVNVRVGEHGGAQVRAPFTHVETQSYRAAPSTERTPLPPMQPMTPLSPTPNASSNASDSNWRPVPAGSAGAGSFVPQAPPVSR
jgi:hypothetical protein